MWALIVIVKCDKALLFFNSLYLLEMHAEIFMNEIITTEPVQIGPILFLTRY